MTSVLRRAGAMLAAGLMLGGAAPLPTVHQFLPAKRVRAEQSPVVLEKSVQVPMRDGTLLSTDVYRPKNMSGQLPVIVMRTPYEKRGWRASLTNTPLGDGPISLKTHSWMGWEPRFFAARGYVVVAQDIRGRHESQGKFFPESAGEIADGFDTLEWIVRQPWSNGKVGSFGCSYDGEAAAALNAAQHPAHQASVVIGAGSSRGTAGGIYNLGFARYGVSEYLFISNWPRSNGAVQIRPPAGVDRQKWFADRKPDDRRIGGGGPEDAAIKQAMSAFPAIDAAKRMTPSPWNWIFEDWLRETGTPRSDYWARQMQLDARNAFNAPSLVVTSWYDFDPSIGIELSSLFERRATNDRARAGQRLVIGGNGHCSPHYATAGEVVGERKIGNASANFPALYLSWFDHHLKGAANGVPDLPRVSTYVNSKSAWRSGPAWPLPGATPLRLFLDSDGRANSRRGNGRLLMDGASPRGGSDVFDYDPRTPVPTAGGMPEQVLDFRAGSIDQKIVEQRADVLVYTSAPLAKGLEVAGPVTVRLFVSSSAVDTDFTAKLVDVAPDGTALNISEGILRARWRYGLDKPVALMPGETYELVVDASHTQTFFKPGHRIRLQISSSNFPRWDRNMNTGGKNYDETVPKVARNIVYHGGDRRSALELLVVGTE